PIDGEIFPGLWARFLRREVPMGHHHTQGNLSRYVQGILSLNQVLHPLNWITLDNLLPDVGVRPSKPHGKLHRPGSSLFINHTVDGAVPHIVDRMQVIRDWFENKVKELRLSDVSDNRTHFSCVSAQIVIEEFFMLE